MKLVPWTALALAALPLALPLPSAAQPKGCPPGLAKKSPACVPPGLARQGDGDAHQWKDGKDAYISGDYVLIRNPDQYGLNPGRTYYRLGDNVFRVDRETGEILDLIGSIAAFLD